MRWRWGLLLGTVALACLFLVASQVVAFRHRGLRPGEMLPSATLCATSGATVKTESWRGSPTLLVLFRPTCPACRAEIALLSEVAPELEGLRIVLLSVQSRVQEDDLPFPVYTDPDGSLLRRTRKLLVPVVYGMDPEGRVVYARVGSGSREEERAMLRHLLSRPGSLFKTLPEAGATTRQPG